MRCVTCDGTGRVCGYCGLAVYECFCDLGPDPIECDDCGGEGDEPED